MQITGDNLLIARETAKALGMGTDIRTAELLPQMMDDGRMPPNLGRDYGHVILPADGFAQVNIFGLNITYIVSGIPGYQAIGRMTNANACCAAQINALAILTGFASQCPMCGSMSHTA